MGSEGATLGMGQGHFVQPRGDREPLRGANRSLDHAEHTQDGQRAQPAGKRRVSIVAIPFLNWTCSLVVQIARVVIRYDHNAVSCRVPVPYLR